MIIELADNLTDCNFAGDDLAAMKVIAHGRRSGYFLLTGSHDVFVSISSQKRLDADEREVFRHAGDQQIEKRGLHAVTSWRVRVARHARPTVEVRDGTNVIVLPLSHFRYPDRVSKPVVLGEALADANLAVEMARFYYGKRGAAAPVELSFQLDQGGGTTTADSFRLHRDASRLCICVVDSDRKCPGGDIGNTARGVLDAQQGEKPWARAVLTGYREAENALPTEVILKVAGDQHKQAAMLRRLGTSSAGTAARDHLDFKRGTNGHDVLEGEDETVRGFWEQTLEVVDDLPPLRDVCAARSLCERGTRGRCTCWILKGFGRPLLRDSIAVLKEMTPDDVDRALCGATREHWMAVGKTVFSWICGTDELKTY